MLAFHEKRRLIRFLQSPLFFCILLVFTGFSSHAAYRAYGTERAVYAHLQELEIELAALVEKRSELERNVERLDDPQGVEGELRKRFGVGRDGEEAIILLEEEKKPAVKAATHEEQKGFWDKFSSIFR